MSDLGGAPGENCELCTGQPRTSPHRDRVWIAKDRPQHNRNLHPFILFKRLCSAQKSIGKHGRGIALWVRDPVDVALRVYGLAVLISRQIDLQIYWLAAKYAGYFWERVTTHECLL